VLGDDVRDHVAQATVFVWGCVEGKAGSRRELFVVPVHRTSSKELLAGQLLQTCDVVLIRKLVHLRVEHKLRRVRSRGRQDDVGVWTTGVAQEVDTCVWALVATPMVWADAEVVTAILRGARMGEDVVVPFDPVALEDYLPGLGQGVAVGESWVILALVQVLYEQLDDCRIVFGEVDFAFLIFLMITS